MNTARGIIIETNCLGDLIRLMIFFLADEEAIASNISKNNAKRNT